MSTNKYTTEQRKIIFLEALKKNLNVITAACEASGVSRARYYEWMKIDPDFKAKVEEVNDIQFDFVETQLLKKIKDGSETSIIFFLKTKGRRRGYGDNLDITTGGDKLTDIKINIIRPEDKKEE